MKEGYDHLEEDHICSIVTIVKVCSEDFYFVGAIIFFIQHVFLFI